MPWGIKTYCLALALPPAGAWRCSSWRKRQRGGYQVMQGGYIGRPILFGYRRQDILVVHVGVTWLYLHKLCLYQLLHKGYCRCSREEIGGKRFFRCGDLVGQLRHSVGRMHQWGSGEFLGDRWETYQEDYPGDASLTRCHESSLLRLALGESFAPALQNGRAS